MNKSSESKFWYSKWKTSREELMTPSIFCKKKKSGRNWVAASNQWPDRKDKIYINKKSRQGWVITSLSTIQSRIKREHLLFVQSTLISGTKEKFWRLDSKRVCAWKL